MNSSVEMSSLRIAYDEMCLALNMDDETRRAGWKNYETVRRTYLIEGDQLHWLSVSLFVCCSLNESHPNPISVDRLLKCSTAFPLREFFAKIGQWANMTNLNEEKRKKFDRLEKSFFISSTIYHKYPRLFVLVFGGNEEKLLRIDFGQQRQLAQLNRKFAKKKEKFNVQEELFALGWTIFALAKSRYPATFVDLSASFHLLVAAVAFLHRLHSSLALALSTVDGERDGEMLSLLASEFRCDAEMCSSIFVEHFLGESFWTSFLVECAETEENRRSTTDDRLRAVSRRIHRSYDELVLSNCFLDERIFFLQAEELIDQISSLNENRSEIQRENQTPLTAAHQLFSSSSSSSSSSSPPTTTSKMSEHLTPLSQTRHLIEQFHSLIEPSSADPLTTIRQLIGNDTCFEHVQGLLTEWKAIYEVEYSRLTSFGRRSTGEKALINLADRYFHLAMKFFASTLQKILLIEEKKHSTTNTNTDGRGGGGGGATVDALRQSREKFFYNVEFFKSLLSLSLLLVFFVHGDEQHDYQWIFQIYSLHAYSFLKIIQIFLKTRKDLQRIRSLVKHLSKVEERIFSSLVWKKNSTFWTEFHRKGFLAFEHVFPSKASLHAVTPQHHPFLLSPSPSSTLQHEHVNRKLFHPAQPTSDDGADGSMEVEGTKSAAKTKSSPYTMFYRKLYQLALYRLDLLAKRLFGPTKGAMEKFAWNLFHFLLEHHFEELLCERDLDQILLALIFFTGDHFHRTNQSSPPPNWIKLIQIYKTMPNSRIQLLRSVCLYPADDQRASSRLLSAAMVVDTPMTQSHQCLTPSKPAGTTSLLDGFVFGDITNFYEEIFLRLPSFPLVFLRQMENESNRIDYPASILRAQQIDTTEHRHIHFSSTNQLPTVDKSLLLLHSSSSHSSVASNSTSANIFSTSKSAGLKSRVQTTRMRTDEGKFFTTISTVQDEERRTKTTDESAVRLFNEENLFFGHFHPTKRPNDASPSDDERENSPLNSLAKKVLLIETDRTHL